MELQLRQEMYHRGITLYQAEIVVMISKGYSNAEISNALDLTQWSIKRHLSQIYTKLNVKSRVQLIVFCLPWLGDCEGVSK